ncbi:PhzF family phenazine biosynthesis protein [Leuconostoc gelidum subsp. gelidum]|uniref:PhzF family phenazine biosynthesis protein n=1 Tax=Leuconostoc gelidum subsp. gelidum TaxID=1607839 RepID=A0AB35G162_LEUGE|nr:PhzF family phenazine biosynthesis protein [Leuconostoc gelidum]MBZ5963609.1 PhzF family phenazine biosynthesis protein [Leuconostoc gelidum subsp. gelidum]MBZ5975549.1 PhzF family phenazine biosynthesis protein [Leuconostoc gelidum subsp. gelidum]MBZ5976283.1 PhzF family phenazine biosynthesis protein [Leuconostoc gelidum subsp. gelidum]MBZ5987066.1 PhzF family phenazine biosynthesis protein [Leuconostoc gelidum subsp. gelidum]MBZ6000263.1 PhzF family phenazine biosynthesis protein [Leucon
MVDVYVASAFSKDNVGGNKAGLVFDRPDLSSVQKMAIAKKLGYAETAFIISSSVADFCLEYFTPTEEVPLCGHATIGTFAILNLLNKLSKNNYTIETKSGVLSIKVDSDGMVFMEQNTPTFFNELSLDLFNDCLDVNSINDKLPIQIVSTGLRDIMMPIKSTKYLQQLDPNFNIMTELSKEQNVIGVHAFALEEGEGNLTAICRNFAPLYDIDEESATGTSNCALACYLFKYVEKKSQYIFEQGYNLNSPSRIIVNLKTHNDMVDAVFVGGYGYLVEKKSLSV